LTAFPRYTHIFKQPLRKKQLLDEMPSLFASSREKQEKNEEDLTAALYQQIGQLKVELDWVKKNLVLAVAEKKELVEAHASSNRDCSAV